MAKQPRPFRTTLFLVLCLIGTLGLSTPLRAQSNVNLPPDLQALIAESLQANPEIKQKSQLKTAAEEAVRPAGALDNPQAGFALLNIPTDTWSFAQEPMTQKAFSLSQKIPFPGKRRLRSEVAEEQARSDDLAYKDKMNEIRAMVIQRYWSLALAYSGYDITDATSSSGNRWCRWRKPATAWARPGSRMSSRPRWNWGITSTACFQWRQRQESFVADLNALRSQPPQTPPCQAPALKAPALDPQAGRPAGPGEIRPQLEALKALIARQEKAVAAGPQRLLPRLSPSGWPTVSGKVGPPGEQTRPDFFTTTFMLDIPIWRGSKKSPKSGSSWSARARPKRPIMLSGTAWRRRSRTAMSSCSAWTSKSPLPPGHHPPGPPGRLRLPGRLLRGPAGFRPHVSEPDRRL